MCFDFSGDSRYRTMLRIRSLGIGFVQRDLKPDPLARLVRREPIGERLDGVRTGIQAHMLGIPRDHDLLVALAAIRQAKRRDAVVYELGSLGCRPHQCKSEGPPARRCVSGG